MEVCSIRICLRIGNTPVVDKPDELNFEILESAHLLWVRY